MTCKISLTSSLMHKPHQHLNVQLNGVQNVLLLLFEFHLHLKMTYLQTLDVKFDLNMDCFTSLFKTV